jgi:phospholipase/carboxylesterase
MTGPFSDARLIARPCFPSIAPDLDVGTHTLKFSGGREAQFHVPARGDAGPAPLLLFFHGARGQDGGVLTLAIEWADRHGVYVIAQKAIGKVWDIVRGGGGSDVSFTDFLLQWTMQRYAIDPARIGIAGFSDGGSCALSIGLTNGDLLRDIMAFSPGFVRTLRRVGQPRIYLAQGKDNFIMSIERGRAIAARLSDDRYDVQYREFGGPRALAQIVDEALARFATVA